MPATFTPRISNAEMYKAVHRELLRIENSTEYIRTVMREMVTADDRALGEAQVSQEVISDRQSCFIPQ